MSGILGPQAEREFLIFTECFRRTEVGFLGMERMQVQGRPVLVMV